MTVKFYLERNKLVSDLKTIYAYVHEKGEGIFLNTNEKININHWDKSLQRANLRKTNNNILKGELKILNQYLDAYQNKIYSIVRNSRIDDPTKDTTTILNLIKQHFSDFKKGFFDSYQEFINSKKSLLSEETIQKYQRTKDLLKEFEKSTNNNLTFSNINYSLYEKFLSYLIIENGMINNTAYKTLSYFKTFLIWANQNGLSDNSTYMNFKLKYVENEVIYLTEDELMTLYNLETKSDKLRRVRDIFCFQCFTGVRYSDIENIKREDIRNNTWYIRTQKTRNLVEVPLNQYALSILMKYSDFPQPLPVISNQKINEYLKILAKEAKINDSISIVKYQGNVRKEIVKKKYELIGSHTARRTFITLSLEKGMKLEVIMSITGHKSYRMIQKYLKIADKHKRTEMDKTWGSPLRKLN